MTSPSAALLALLALLPLSASALTWRQQTIRVATAPFQTTQDAAFEFTNESTKPVTLLDIQSNCDCLSVVADKKTYAPGERGVIRGQFTVGDRIGLYTRRVKVLTDESDTPAELVLEVDVPAVATVTPQTVTWQPAATAIEKVVDVHPTGDLVIEFTSLQPTNEAFLARLETVTPGKHYRVYLTPRQPEQPANAAIRVIGREKTGHDVVVSTYANVH